MALLDKLKKNIPPMGGQENMVEQQDFSQQQPVLSPVEKIQQMRAQGLNNNQIVQSLQRDGLDSAQILDAMNQLDTQPATPLPPPMGAPQGMSPPPDMPPPPMGMQQSSSEGMDRQKIEELAEVIIDEKWEELIKSLNKITEWKDSTESRLNKIEQQFTDLKSDFDNLHKAIIGKIGEYDQNILNVGTEIKAMEKVFQKILPTFTENVAELSRITKRASSKPVKKK